MDKIDKAINELMSSLHTSKSAVYLGTPNCLMFNFYLYRADGMTCVIVKSADKSVIDFNEYYGMCFGTRDNAIETAARRAIVRMINGEQDGQEASST